MSIIGAIDPYIAATDYLGHGYDVSKGLPGLAPIFTYTYNSGQTWQSPYSKITYLVPDQMSVSPLEEVREIIVEGSYSSYSEFLEMYRKFFYLDLNVQIDSFGAAFKYNQELGYVYEKMQSQYAMMMHGNYEWTYYTATLYPAYILAYNPMFQEALNLFPEQIITKDDYAKAMEFVNAFGTHYMSGSIFGAKVDYNTGITQELISTYKYQWIETQYTLNFYYNLFVIDNGGYTNKSNIIISQEFLENANANVTFLGGDPTVANLQNMSIWIKTLDSNTFPLNTTLSGLWNLVVGNDTKKNTMMNFIINYTNAQSRYLNDVDVSFPCLGYGLDITNLTGCLLPVYVPSANNTWIQNTTDSELIQLSATMTDYFDIEAWSTFSYSCSNMFGFGSKSTVVYDFYDMYYINDKSLSITWLELSYVTVTAPILPPPRLNPEFVIALDKLPLNYDPLNPDNQEIFFEFIRSFGIAVVDQIVLGGYFQCNMYYDKSLLSQYSGQEISEFASWSFAGIIGDGHGHTSNNTKVNIQFNQSLIIASIFVGGEQNFTIDEYEEWARTVKANQQIIKYHLQPITNFITNANTQYNVQAAILDYTNLSVQQLQNYINSLNT